MKYFKKLNEDGTLQRLDACEFNSCDGIEITEEEYNELMPKVECDFFEYAEGLKAEGSEV
jgi:hypothetical protein